MYIGIDIGGTAIKAGLVNENGEILYKKEIRTRAEREYKDIERDIIELIKDLIKRSNEYGKNVKSIGLGIPGIGDVTGDFVVYCTNLGWRNVPLGKNLKSQFNLPIYIENDATVAGLAENVKGATKGSNSSIFITLGTGVGGGIIIDGKVYSGAHGTGSEIGHMIVGENFYDCNCGNNGCLETFASATAIIKYTTKIIKHGNNDTLILEKTGGDLNKITAKLVFDCAKEGDKVANESIDRMVKYLSIGIANLLNTLDPEIVAIGGGVSKAGDFLLEKVRKQVGSYLLYKDIKYADIVLATLGNDAGLVGAAMLGKYK
ncbi:ROK family protein [Caldisalinibacter kiritimatiensis]|uniref:Glucokinase n=1 Tax=Caldisalinibacter kiritimatiensis TaxID=1304284 RepID=R1CNZ9_9FIRM|nr:ROK family protein [Caldisalinibacter kiritimatiensis]EOD00426.1 Glucokinase [Caldisalinibacter kiritimatiensis]